LVLLLLLSLSSPLMAQSDSLTLPFSEGSRTLFTFHWQEQITPSAGEEKTISYEKKSPSRAFFSSLILPGIGEAYVGEEFQSKLFLGLELVGWGLVIANIINVNMRMNDYQNYAVVQAMVNPNAKDDQYWINIGKFDTIYEYNEERRRERDLEALYPETKFYSWQWNLTDNRLNYDAYRIETREIENNRLYFFAAIALNHLVSAINALRLANAHNRRIEEKPLNLNFDYNPQRQQFSFSLNKYF
jgi:hypothetical protein